MKILGILPESIGGRLTTSSILDGFTMLGHNVTVYDELKDNFQLNNEYDLIVGYDFSALKIKKDNNLTMKSVNYFSDEIRNRTSGPYWQELLQELEKDDNFTFYWDRELVKQETFKNIFYCIFVDCHNKPYIKIPMIHLSTQELFVQDIQKHYKNEDIIIVSPDKGRSHISNSIAKMLGCTSINGEKIRDDNGDIIHISFNYNVNNKLCILCDDIIDTGKTLLFSANQLFKIGTKEIITYATHATFNEETEKLLNQSSITKIVITDSIQKKLEYPNKFEKLSIASLIVKTIQAIL